MPVNVELVKILTILELTGGKFSRDPAKIKSTVRSSIFIFITIRCKYECLIKKSLFTNKISLHCARIENQDCAFSYQPIHLNTSL